MKIVDIISKINGDYIIEGNNYFFDSREHEDSEIPKKILNSEIEIIEGTYDNNIMIFIKNK